MIAELRITEKNLRCFSGRFVKTELSEDSLRDAIAKIVLFRKLGCSSVTVKELLSKNEETYKAVLHQAPDKNDAQKAAALESLQGIALQNISYAFCTEVLRKSGLLARKLPYDRFFCERVCDSYNAMIVAGVWLSRLLFYHSAGWKSILFALLWGIVFDAVVIASNAFTDLHPQ